MIELDPAGDPAAYVEAELRRNAESCGRSKITRFYRALDGHAEIGFVALDHWPEQLVIYELRVLSRVRNQGYAVAIIQAIEKLATENSYRPLAVLPSPLENTVNEQRLVLLYTRAGFVPDATEHGLFRKSLPDAAS